MTESERKDLGERVAKVETRLDGVIEGLGEVKDALKWFTRTIGAAGILWVAGLLVQLARSGG